MRLVRLDMVGFGAFREPSSLEFEDTDFFALVGPTGSGKSTVIDAVCFALYGCVPRYEDQRLNRYVITLGSSEARVALTFELDGNHYVAARVLRRNNRGQVSTREARLERTEADGTTTSLAGTERDLNQAVENLLRLSFDDFTRCVVLPQGEFSQFLRAKGDDRRALLIRLLNLDVYLKVGQRAGQVAETARAQSEIHRRRQSDLAFATPEALKEAADRAKAIRALAGDAGKTRPKVEERVRLAEADERRQHEAEHLTELLAKISVPTDARVHAALQAEADLALREAQGELAGARRKRQETAAATSGLPELAVLKQADQAHDRLGDCNDELGKAEEEAGKARQERDEMSSGLADAESELEAAASRLEGMRLAHQAVDLAGKLVVGQPCPVCLHVVESIAEHAVPEDLTKAKAAQVAAQKKVNALREKHTDAASKAAGWVSRFQTLSAERDRVLDQVAAYPAREPLQLLIGEVQAENDALASARLNEDSWTATCDERQGSANNLVAKAAGFQTSYDSQRDSVAVLGPPEAKHTDLFSDWDSLAGWAAEARVAQDKVGSEAATRAQAHRQAAADLVRELVARCQELDISAEGDVVNVLTALTEASAQAESRVTTINQAINENKALEEEITELVEEAEVASALRTLLRADHFPEWLISEALELLVADASRTLRALTNDAFSLTLGDKEFMIIDHANADEQRSARTLSGGETFQASLALALALSDQIRGLAADGAPRLDALFLDEGFGTLDAETLDTVASTIENLGQSGRMVGIISHVRELAARVPVRFEIRKGPRSATVEKVYA